MIIKELTDRVIGRDVTIECKPYGSTAMIEYRGKVVECFATVGREEIFWELDTGDLINIHYIIAIKIHQ